MRSYGQFCPVAKAAELFCERWTPLILRDLAAGATRFSELHRGVPLMSRPCSRVGSSTWKPKAWSSAAARPAAAAGPTT